MSENTLNIVKYISLIVIFITGIILLFMYPYVFKIKQFTNDLDTQLQALYEQEEILNNKKENLIKNKDKLIEDYLRKDLSMIKEEETLISY